LIGKELRKLLLYLPVSIAATYHHHSYRPSDYEPPSCIVGVEADVGDRRDWSKVSFSAVKSLICLAHLVIARPSTGLDLFNSLNGQWRLLEVIPSCSMPFVASSNKLSLPFRRIVNPLA